jgi:hypothetical protein
MGAKKGAVRVSRPRLGWNMFQSFYDEVASTEKTWGEYSVTLGVCVPIWRVMPYPQMREVFGDPPAMDK